jgi:hypothetical protein
MMNIKFIYNRRHKNIKKNKKLLPFMLIEDQNQFQEEGA